MNIYMSDNNSFQNMQMIDIENTPEMLFFRAKIAKHLGLTSLIYAAFSTFCLYRNLSGVMMPFFGIATLIYMIYGLRQYDVKIKKTSWFIAGVILALAVSDFLTCNHVILFYNNAVIGFMIILFLLHNVYDDSRWDFSKTLRSICRSCISSIGSLVDFGLDMRALSQRRTDGPENSTKKSTVKYIIIGLIFAMPLTLIILLLLSTADAVFNELLGKILYLDIDIEKIVGIAFTFFMIFFGGYCVMRFFSKKVIREDYTANRNLEPVIAITVLSIVSVIYLLFSGIQIIYLFLGDGTPPLGYSYARYAREGFFELLAVSVINFLMVLFVNKRFRESSVLKVLMTIISLCTYIMIASSALRIKMYIDAYLLTSLRIWVVWGLIVLSLLFVAVIISIYKHDFPIFRYGILVVSVLYIMISYARPDYIIADYNLKHINTSEHESAVIDYNYLKRLSADAAPAIAEYCNTYADEDDENSFSADYFRRCRNDYRDRSLRQFNLSAYTAEKLSGNDR